MRFARIIAPLLATTALASAAPPPTPSTAPAGDQFLGIWGRRFATSVDGPDVLFLLPDRELAGLRYGREVPAIARTLVEEAIAVLDEGCRAATCSEPTTRARALLQSLLAAQPTATAPHARHWTATEAGLAVDKRSITTRLSASGITVDVLCSCASQTIGMGLWNDIASCTATVRDHGRPLLRYEPRVRRGEDKGVSYALDAYDQTLVLGTGPTERTLVITSGTAPRAVRWDAP